MKNKMEDLRNHLFAALEGLADTENPMEIERAKAICEVGQVLINTAKVEVEHMKIAGGKGSAFMAEREPPRLIAKGST